jgi:stearoyl-CoA desaturase (delta-9 desaturase)
MKLAIILVLVTLAALKVAERRAPRAVLRGLLLVGVLLPLVATAYAIWRAWGGSFGWTEFALFAGGYVVTGLGTTIGYHRLVTHRSFETKPALKLLFLALGAMALQGRILNWAAWHLEHHAHSDRQGDPHSPLEGFFHAHVGWILGATPARIERYCRSLLRDPVVRFVDRTTVFWVGLGLAVPYAVAGWSGLLWGGLVRIAFGNHMTFAINSVCHTFGTRPFETRDESRNNWFMGTVGLGEGWHNNHHAFPSSASHGLSWRQPDLSALTIRLLALLGLAWDVKGVDEKSIERRRREALG